MRDNREHTRVPLTVEMRFRTASSFLVAYSLNLSRGGVLLETEDFLPIGTRLTLRFCIDRGETFEVEGTVTWTRARSATEEPGMGVEFKGIDETLGNEIDRLVKGFAGVHVIIYSPDHDERLALGRLVRAIVSAVNLREAADSDALTRLLDPTVDLVLVDTEAPDGDGWLALRAAQNADPPIPAIALVNGEDHRRRAFELGAAEAAPNPPVLAELRPLLIRTLGKPAAVD